MQTKTMKLSSEETWLFNALQKQTGYKWKTKDWGAFWTPSHGVLIKIVGPQESTDETWRDAKNYTHKAILTLRVRSFDENDLKRVISNLVRESPAVKTWTTRKRELGFSVKEHNEIQE